MIVTETHYDCIVIGGGPAGSTVAALLAKMGHRVVVLEKARFPRHHIGESLMPQTYWTFQRLGLLERMKASAFPRKESVQFVSAEGRESLPYYFTDRDPHECSVTWQVRRDEFDRMMLDHAAECGADVRQGVLVKEVLFDGSRAIGVRAVADGQTVELRAKVIVDASGQSSILSRQLDLRVIDATLKNAAIYAYYKGAQRDAGRDEGATLVIRTPDRQGWFWVIPLPDDITSVGVVAPPSQLFGDRAGDPLSILEMEIGRCEPMAKRVRNARRVEDVHVLRDFSYRSRAVAGDGWVLIGDAYSFIDPVYSSGVMLALKSGEMAADAIHEALLAGDFCSRRLGSFQASFDHGMQMIRQLVHAFYDPGFSFGGFLRKFPQFHDNVVRILIGDVFDNEVGQMFEAMRIPTGLPDSAEHEELSNP